MRDWNSGIVGTYPSDPSSVQLHIATTGQDTFLNIRVNATELLLATGGLGGDVVIEIRVEDHDGRF